MRTNIPVSSTMSDNHEGKSEKKTIRLSPKRWIQVKFVVCAISIVLAESSYDTLLFLQSSINIKKGVGVASVTTVYTTATLYGLLFAPMFLRSFGAKTALIFSQTALFLYLCANFYPSFYTMIPAGLIAGIGQATIWPATLVYSLYFARQYSKYSGKGKNAHNAQFIGCQMCFHKLLMTLGNLFSFRMLTGHSVTFPEVNATIDEEMELSHCGSNDCQDPNITDSNLDQYVPASKSSTYIVLGVLASLILIGTLGHVLFLEKIDPDSEEQDKRIRRSNKEEDKFLEDDLKEGLDIELKSRSDMDADRQIQAATPAKSSHLKFMADTLKATGRYLIQPKQLLVMPFAVLSGLFPAFVFSELTRAYASCVLGVAKVGLCAAIFNFVCAFANLLTGMIVSKHGRNLPLLIAVVITLANFVVALLWVPQLSSSWIVYCLFVSSALSDAIFRITITELYASYFPGQQDIAYTVWVVCFTSGFAIQFGWSTSLCVSEKIYAQIAIVCLGSVCYSFAEIGERRLLKNVENNTAYTSNNTLKKSRV